MINQHYLLNARNDLKEYLGDKYKELRGQPELRDIWNKHEHSNANDYYANKINDMYLYDLSGWHSSGTCEGYGNPTEKYASGTVLDFGGGIGSYSLIASEYANSVYYLDINQSNQDFAEFRFNKYKRMNIGILRSIPDAFEYNTIICIDVLEHMEDPIGLLTTLTSKLTNDGHLLLFYTPHTSNGEHPMHIMTHDQVKQTDTFMSRNYTWIEHGVYKKK